MITKEYVRIINLGSWCSDVCLQSQILRMLRQQDQEFQEFKASLGLYNKTLAKETKARERKREETEILVGHHLNTIKVRGVGAYL